MKPTIRKPQPRYVPTATRRRDVPKPTKATPNVNLHITDAITHTSGVKYNGNPLGQMA